MKHLVIAKVTNGYMIQYPKDDVKPGDNPVEMVVSATKEDLKKQVDLLIEQM